MSRSADAESLGGTIGWLRAGELAKEEEPVDQRDRGLGLDALLLRAPVDEFGQPCDPQLDEGGDEGAVGISSARGKAVRLEEEREDRVGIGARHDGPCGLDQLEVIGRWVDERLGKRLLELDAHRQDDLADQLILGREVVHDDAITDPEALGQSTERELTGPVLEGGRNCSFENLCLGVFVTHSG